MASCCQNVEMRFVKYFWEILYILFVGYLCEIYMGWMWDLYGIFMGFIWDLYGGLYYGIYMRFLWEPSAVHLMASSWYWQRKSFHREVFFFLENHRFCLFLGAMVDFKEVCMRFVWELHNWFLILLIHYSYVFYWFLYIFWIPFALRFVFEHA